MPTKSSVTWPFSFSVTPTTHGGSFSRSKVKPQARLHLRTANRTLGHLLRAQVARRHMAARREARVRLMVHAHHAQRGLLQRDTHEIPRNDRLEITSIGAVFMMFPYEIT